MTMTPTKSSTRRTTGTSTRTRSRPSNDRKAYSMSRKEGWRRYVDTPLREQPDPLSPDQLKQLGTRAREDYDEDRDEWHANFKVLRTPQLEAVHDQLDLIVAAGRHDPDRVRGAAVIDALPGMGKTTAANTFARRLDRKEM